MSEKRFEFFNPIGPTSVPLLTPNLPLGLGALDFNKGSLNKNIPHFEELATSFGLHAIKTTILKNTLQFFETPPSPQKADPAFGSGISNTPDGELPIVSRSVFGFPVYSNLSIVGGSYSDNQGNTIGTFDSIQMEAVIFEINRENNLVITDIQGRDNSVIEYISKKSWRINCKGRVMSDKIGVYPRTAVDNLIKALDCNRSLPVDSWFLNMAGIYNIVIQRKSLPQEEGSQEYQKFEFDAVADAPIILKRQA